MKMYLNKLLFSALVLFVGFYTVAQDDEDRECKRMRFLGSKALEVENYKEAAIYYLKGETICGNFEKQQYDILAGSLGQVVNKEKDEAAKKAYMDTICGVFDRMNEKGFYDQSNDLMWAYYILNSSNVDNVKADSLFVRGIKAAGKNTPEAFISYYYYNLYVLWNAAKDDNKAKLKKRIITEYFHMSQLISEGNMSARTQETITQYFNVVVQSCEDILPELGEFMNSFPQDPELKKSTVMNFISLLEKKECEDAPEYIQLIDTLVSVDPNSFEAQYMKAKALEAKNNYSGAIGAYKKAKENTNEEAQQESIDYSIARCQYKMGSFTSAYNTALSVKGENRGEALVLAGNAVAANANNCGASTFQRKCNYIYAVQLLEQGAALGASTGGAIGRYKANYPTEQECFENGNPSSVTLECYGVSVSPCN